MAALRETKEEAGLSPKQLEIDKDFKHEMRYLAYDKPKIVTYWLAHLSNNEDITISDEHQNHKWAELDEAIKLSNFPEIEGMLKKAESYINKKVS